MVCCEKLWKTGREVFIEDSESRWWYHQHPHPLPLPRRLWPAWSLSIISRPLQPSQSRPGQNRPGRTSPCGCGSGWNQGRVPFPLDPGFPVRLGLYPFFSFSFYYDFGPCTLVMDGWNGAGETGRSFSLPCVDQRQRYRSDGSWMDHLSVDWDSDWTGKTYSMGTFTWYFHTYIPRRLLESIYQDTVGQHVGNSVRLLLVLTFRDFIVWVPSTGISHSKVLCFEHQFINQHTRKQRIYEIHSFFTHSFRSDLLTIIDLYQCTIFHNRP